MMPIHGTAELMVLLLLLLFSVGYGVRLMAGRADVACFRDAQHGVDLLIQEGLDHTNCAIVFLLLYFFGMAASLWSVASPVDVTFLFPVIVAVPGVPFSLAGTSKLVRIV